MEENANGKEFPMPSGATLYVSIADYDSVMDLHDALANELRGKGMGGLDVAAVWRSVQKVKAARDAGAQPFEDEGDDGAAGLNVLMDKFLALGASKEFKAAVFKCAERAVYRFDGSLASSIQFKFGTPGYGVFDDPRCRDTSRGDFYAIVKAVVEENLRPFGAALLSMFAAHMVASAASQKSNTDQGSPKGS